METAEPPAPRPPDPVQRVVHARRAFLIGLVAATGVGLTALADGAPRATLLAQGDDHEHCENFHVQMLGGDCVKGRYMARALRRVWWPVWNVHH
jgi:hypothetical protein